MQNQQPNYNALLNYILNPGGNTARTAEDILKGTGLQGTYNTQVGVGNAATQASQGVTDKALAGPVNGSYVNAAPMQDTQNQNMIKDSSMPVNLLLGILSQASQSTQNAANNAASISNNAVNAGNTARQLSGQESLNGQTYDPTTGQVSFGGGANNGNGYSPQTVQDLADHGAADLFAKAKTPAQQEELYNAIQQAGGIAQYRTKNKQSQPPGLADTVTESNQTINHIDFIQKQIAQSAALRNYLNLGPFQGIVNAAEKINKNAILSPEDRQALAYLTSLNAVNDKNQVGGRLGSQILQMIGPSSVGTGLSYQTNRTMLSRLKNQMLQNLHDTYVTPYGYGTVMDLPGLQAGNIHLVNSKGQTGSMSYEDFRKKGLPKGFSIMGL